MRLAAWQTALFLLAFVLAVATARTVIQGAETRAAHAEIEEMEDDLTDLLNERGAAALATRIDARRPDAVRVLRLDDASGRRLAGALPAVPTPVAARRAWMNFVVAAPGPRRGHRILAFSRAEPGGLRLGVGEDLTQKEAHDDAVLTTLVVVATALAGVGMLGGVLTGRRVLRRVDAMAQVVEGYAAGERDARVAVARGGASELDGLAEALNRMMTRENRLVEGLRQVSSAIAHDLRHPLARHNQEIAQALGGPQSVSAYRRALERAAAGVEDVLQTFQALLHIAELDAGAPGLTTEPVDLDAVAARMVEAYRPMAEAGGRTLVFVPPSAPAWLNAESRTLGRMIANLIENALTHTPAGTWVEVRVDAHGPRLSVSDDGPGVPDAARPRLFDRFYRLDASRSTPGSGLGLALAAATARAFGGELSAYDAAPGLRVTADFAGATARARPADVRSGGACPPPLSPAGAQ